MSNLAEKLIVKNFFIIIHKNNTQRNGNIVTTNLYVINQNICHSIQKYSTFTNKLMSNFSIDEHLTFKLYKHIDYKPRSKNICTPYTFFIQKGYS